MKPATSVAEFGDLRSTVRDFIAKAKKLYIDGKWVEAASGKTFSTIDPATEQVSRSAFPTPNFTPTRSVSLSA